MPDLIGHLNPPSSPAYCVIPDLIGDLNPLSSPAYCVIPDLIGDLLSFPAPTGNLIIPGFCGSLRSLSQPVVLRHVPDIFHYLFAEISRRKDSNIRSVTEEFLFEIESRCKMIPIDSKLLVGFLRNFPL